MSSIFSKSLSSTIPNQITSSSNPLDNHNTPTIPRLCYPSNTRIPKKKGTIPNNRSKEVVRRTI